jgi:hypothetical protein
MRRELPIKPLLRQISRGVRRRCAELGSAANARPVLVAQRLADQPNTQVEEGHVLDRRLSVEKPRPQAMQ